MSRDDILNMPTGREMDALVMEYVTEYTVDDNFYIPSYSTDIVAAWNIVEKMKLRNNVDCKVEIRFYDNYWHVDFNQHIMTECFGESLPLAICRAALLAVMEAK